MALRGQSVPYVPGTPRKETSHALYENCRAFRESLGSNCVVPSTRVGERVLCRTQVQPDPKDGTPRLDRSVN